MLVGNKCDLENIREVSVEEGKSLAEAEGLFFMETSALDTTNVQTAFETVIREIYNNISRKVLNSDSYKAELSVNRVNLDNGAGSKQRQLNFSCCSRWALHFHLDFKTCLDLSTVVSCSLLNFFCFSLANSLVMMAIVSYRFCFLFHYSLLLPFLEGKRNGKLFTLPWICLVVVHNYHFLALLIVRCSFLRYILLLFMLRTVTKVWW